MYKNISCSKWRKNISKSLKGRKITWNHKISETLKRKHKNGEIVSWCKGRKNPKLSKKKKSLYETGKIKKLYGKDNHFFGKTHSEEVREKLSKSLKIHFRLHPPYNKNREKRICLICKKEFEITKNNPQKFCSRKCYGKYKSDNFKGKLHPLYGKSHKEETILKIKKTLIGKMSGKKNPMYGKHHTLKARNNMSEKQSKNLRKKKWKWYTFVNKGIGKRLDLNNQFFRSRWEANYARYLNYLNIKWVYEIKTFVFEKIKKGTIRYTPDFFLPEKNEYHEVKGYLSRVGKTAIKRFRKYYPNEKLVLIDGKIYREIEKKYKNIIKNWELPNQKR